MSRIRKALMLAVLVVLALIGPCVLGMAESGTGLNLPNALPDGSTMVSVRDVFTEVADEATAQQLRAHMPHVLGGTEYRYVLEENGSVEAEWGIVVFEFENEQVALESFLHLADEVATVNKNPRFIRIEGAEDMPAIQDFLNSDLEYGCLMDEVILFPLGSGIIWVDDYTVALEATSIQQQPSQFGSALFSALKIVSILAVSPSQPAEALMATKITADTKATGSVIVDGHTVALVEAELARSPISVGEETELIVRIYPQQDWEMPTSLYPTHPIPNPFIWGTKAGEVLVGYEEDVAIARGLADHRLIYHFSDRSVEIHELDCSGDLLVAVAQDLLGLYGYTQHLPAIYIPAKILQWALPSLIGNEASEPQNPRLRDNNRYDQHVMGWGAPKNGAIDMPNHIGVGEFVEVIIPMKFEEPGEHELYLYVNGLFVYTGAFMQLKYMHASTEFPLAVNVDDSQGAVGKALQWLRTQQHTDGSWDYFEHESVGITALATLGFLNAGYDASDQNVKHGLDYIVSKYNSTEGWISAEDVKRGNDEVLVYDTALAVLPLIFARHVDYTPPDGSPSLQAILKGAARYLVNQQSMDTSNPYSYGGWGYPRDNWADLSNTQWVLLALETIRREAGITAPMPNWTAAATFVARCWNTDGGFAYRPGGKSYGSMTGAGVWSLLICGWNGISTIQIAPGNSVALAEPLQRGLDWLSTKNEVRSNPGAESQWYYYYLVTVAKTYLFAEGNIGLDWYNDMASYLTKQLQKDDGRFPAVYEEEEPDVMATAEAVLALQTRAEPPEILQNTELWIVLASHADLHVYDSEGRHVGRNYETGLIDIEIPGASYRADGTQAIGISRPSAGRYRIELVGTSYGEYSLTVEGRRAGETISTKSFTGVIEEDVKHSTTATLTSIVGPLTVFVGKPRPLPEGLYAIPGDGQIELHWRSYTDPGFQLAGYNVYRSTRSGGGYTRVNASLISGTEHTDKRTKSWKTYYYVITAVDRSGNETGYSPEAEGIAFPQGLLESIVRLILGILQAILSLFGL